MPVYRRHRMKLLVVSYCVSEVLILPIASVHASNRCLCSNTADHRGSKEPQSPRANVQRYSRATTSIPHINGPDDIPHSITTKPSLFYSVQLPLNRNNNNTIRPRIRNLRQRALKFLRGRPQVACGYLLHLPVFHAHPRFLPFIIHHPAQPASVRHVDPFQSVHVRWV